jgi:hypothetical protein
MGTEKVLAVGRCSIAGLRRIAKVSGIRTGNWPWIIEAEQEGSIRGSEARGQKTVLNRLKLGLTDIFWVSFEANARAPPGEQV